MNTIYEPKGRALEYSFLALNLYDGCSHGCGYCYVPKILRRDAAAFATDPKVRPGVISALSRAVVKFANTKKRVLLSFTSDPYQPLEERTETTRQAITILKCHSIPFQILTKGGWLPTRDFELYCPGDTFAVTMTTLNIKQAERWEPDAAPPSERIAALVAAHERGIPTWISLEPLLDIPEAVRIMKETKDFVDHYKLGTLNHASIPLAAAALRDYVEGAIEYLTENKKTYYIKHDLLPFVPGTVIDKMHQTDTRRI